MAGRGVGWRLPAQPEGGPYTLRVTAGNDFIEYYDVLIGEVQKSYADKRRRDLKFSVGDLVFVKTSPLKSVIRFGRRGKLAPRFVGPFPVLELVGNLAYRIDLPEKMAGVHNVFHISQLRKFVHDPDVTISPDQLDDIEVEPEAVGNRKPMRIVGNDTKQLRRKAVNLVKVQWGRE